MKVSPAPVESTACTRRAGKCCTPASVTATTPRSPRVTRTFAAPWMRRRRATSVALSIDSTRRPVSVAASISFGTRKSAHRITAGGSSWAGAGLSTTIFPCSLAARAARSTVARGVSSCRVTTRALAIRRAWRSMSSGASSPLAPETTTMPLRPLSSTTIRATPDDRPGTVLTAETSTWSVSSPLRSWCPKASSPTQPIIAVRAPRRAAATAWFAPLPPGTVENPPPSSVSPGTGRRGARTTRSMFRLPTTTTSLMVRRTLQPAGARATVTSGPKGAFFARP